MATIEPKPTLYVKDGCPWCEEAIAYLDDHGVAYTQKEVRGDAAAFAEMQKLSGQTKAPTLDWNGKILADFGVEELSRFLVENGVKLEDS